MLITTATEQNKRSSQEDRTVVKNFKNGDILLAVLDGHGGSRVAEIAANKIPYIFKSICRLYPTLSDHDVILSLFKRLNYLTCNYSSGAACSLVWVKPSLNLIHVAVLGDCPVLLKQPDENIWRAPEHNVRTNAIEAQRAIKNGARIYNGYMFGYFGMDEVGIQMSRALGDKILHGVIERIPEIFTFSINFKDSNNLWLLLASDGLFDPSHNILKNPYKSRKIEKRIEKKNNKYKEFLNFIENKDIVAKDLIQYSDQKDNATAILVRL